MPTPPARRSVDPLFWALAQLGSRIRARAPKGVAEEARAVLPAPRSVHVPTRHGEVRVLVQRPRVLGPESPVVLHFHGGGFVNRCPEQDLHIARSFAAGFRAIVLMPDYDTGPRVQYPVAEEQAADIARWVRDGADAELAGRPLLLSGVSAGAKLCINVCQQFLADGAAPPSAVALVVPVTDLTRTDRTSGIRRPAISPFVQRFVGWAYIPDVPRRTEAMASPRLDPRLAEAMPPTLILTAEHDTLAPEGAELARMLRAGGVEVEHHESPGVDHGFLAAGDRVAMLDGIERMAAFLESHVTGRFALGSGSARPVNELRSLLAAIEPELIDGAFVYASVPTAELPDHLHRGPVAIIRETEGTTLIVPASKSGGLSASSPMRMITLTVFSSLEAVGLTAAVATALTRAGISANVIAGYHHDHILVPERHALAAMSTLAELSRGSAARPSE